MPHSFLGITRKTPHLGFIDVTPPTCALTSAASDPVYAAFSVTATFSEVVTGFDAAADIIVTNGTATDPVDSGDGKTYTFDVAPVASGTVTVQVGAGVCVDGAGNPNTASNVLTREAILWLLLDRFVTDRAAGSVDGTAAEPGPGVREVTDTSGTGVAITSGRLNIVGIGTFADEGVYWTDDGGNGFARQAGRALLAISNAKTGASLNIHLAWANAATSDYTGLANIEYGIYHRTTLRLTNQRNVGAYALDFNADYELVFILRAAGAFFLVDGELAYVTNIGTATQLWPGLTANTSPSGLQLDDLRVVDLPLSDATLYPIPVVSDSFDRDNGAIGSTDGAGHAEGQTTPQGNGVPYSNASTWTISSNAATNTPSVAANNLCYAESGDAEVFHSAEVARTAGEAGIVVNAADTDNYIRVVHDGTNANITEVVNGVPNVLATVAKTYSAGARITARRIGNTLRALYNDSLVAEVTPNIALQNNTLHGLYSDSSGNTFDDLETWPTTGYSYGEYA